MRRKPATSARPAAPASEREALLAHLTGACADEPDLLATVFALAETGELELLRLVRDFRDNVSRGEILQRHGPASVLDERLRALAHLTELALSLPRAIPFAEWRFLCGRRAARQHGRLVLFLDGIDALLELLQPPHRLAPRSARRADEVRFLIGDAGRLVVALTEVAFARLEQVLGAGRIWIGRRQAFSGPAHDLLSNALE